MVQVRPAPDGCERVPRIPVRINSPFAWPFVTGTVRKTATATHPGNGEGFCPPPPRSWRVG